MRVVGNCDIPFYADPTHPDCPQTDDGVECTLKEVEECHSAVELTVTTVDRAVHVKHEFELPLIQSCSDGGRRALQQGAPAYAEQAEEVDAELAALANLFRDDRQAGLAYPMAVTPFRCDAPEHAEKDVCQKKAQANGGGHRRQYPPRAPSECAL